MRSNALIIALGIWLNSCQTNQVAITSTPSGADVEIYSEDKESYEKVGVTPLDLSESASKLPVSILYSDLLTLRISKPGFVSEQVLMEKSGRPKIKIHANLSAGEVGEGKVTNYELINETAQTVNLVQKLIAEKRWDQALTAVDGLLTTYPMAYYLWDMKGSIHLAQGSVDMAKQAYRKSMEIKPDNLDTKLMLKELED